MDLKSAYLDSSHDPDVRAGMQAIFAIRDLLQLAGVPHEVRMQHLGVLAATCGLLDHARVTEKLRSSDKAQWIGGTPSCVMHDETAIEHVKNALQIVYANRSPMDSQGNVLVPRTTLDGIVERLLKALSHLEVPSSPIESPPLPPESQSIEQLQDDPYQDWEDAGNGEYQVFDRYQDYYDDDFKH
jgi:hypothetical protein